ncbi:MAG: prepilin peptidase [Catenulispora sp.]|nr:prepilin peptidase [Catenulispora sp.]NUR57220.1 prepilin peptidase [Catenulispora sp.]
MPELHAEPFALAAGASIGCIAGVLGAHAASRASGPSSRPRRWGLLAGMIGAIAGTAVAVRFGTGVQLAAYLLFVAVALPLSAIDIAVRKVPDRILVPAVPAAIALLALAAHHAGACGELGRALLAGIATFGAYVVLALATGQVGLGDCKAAGLCGLYLGFLGVRPAALGVVAAFVLASVGSVISRVRRGSGRDRTLAFVPYIFTGTLLVILVG